ncbi:hypothetical protein G4B88_013738 [Cannabis sativa]|uniref:Protein kinase domain-containing protein n=1 Tax=Cannabis sativa TaxID=3483 RepID=A0A7J6HV19_CANSA|nr:hypothetical protein G4B88_013738 [Cannabis sativa]
MRMVMPPMLQLVILSFICFSLLLQGSTGITISPSPAIYSGVRTLGPVPHGTSKDNAPSSESQPIESPSHPEVALPPLPSTPASQIKGLEPSMPPSVTKALPPSLPPSNATQKVASTPAPQTINRLEPSLPPSFTKALPPSNANPLPPVDQIHAPATPPTTPQEKAPVTKPPVSVPVMLTPPPLSQGHAPTVPPTASQRKKPVIEAPISLPVAPVPVATPSMNIPHVSPAFQPSIPATSPINIPHVSPAFQPSIPATSPVNNTRRNSTDNKGPISSTTPVTNHAVPAVSPTSQAPQSSPFIHPATPRGSPSTVIPVSPASSPPRSIEWKKKGIPASAPLFEKPKAVPPVDHITANGPSKHKSVRHSYVAPAPSTWHPNPPNKGDTPVSSPSAPFYEHHHSRNKITNPAPASSYPVSPPPIQHGFSGSPSDTRFPPPLSYIPPAPAPSQKAASGNTNKLFPSKPPSESPKVSLAPPPKVSRLPPPKVSRLPPPKVSLVFPPPPPNEDCSTMICTEPFTNTPPGSPCGCVLPIQVGLRLSVALYTFFPLVSELAQEISSSVFVKQSQVRIIGANSANQQPEKTVVLVDLVPMGERFDNTTAFLTYQRFWNKQVTIQSTYFGDYEVLYVRYPGLPASPPSDVGMIDDGPYAGSDNNARTIKPLGVDLPKRQHKKVLSGGIIAIIVLSAFLILVSCSVAAWIFLFKHRDKGSELGPAPRVLLPSLSKPSGAPASMLGSRDSSASLSFGSSIATYTGSAKTFSTSDIEKATDHFNASRILGEGGFGLVYSGVLEDGTKVAVKVLKRDDQQGGREFLAEVEMLSRLHHRNLVKLIGICTEERNRCLVYELVPNGSVESHLHGIDKEAAPLNWPARMKIALGAARGLAYLHEDSSPRVIHRDFKSSNILLEEDFMPKVSDFGLARSAMDEENQHISTRVMGTFGYVAPEYAMTGHLLVKSDVYSYGVVLLELLTGRKPVDMSQPPGQENLVAWARPLLASKEGLETIIDPSLVSEVPFESVAKVAAIASMCVQPEVSNRPFMGEVVQALKLVCNEIEEAKNLGSRTSSRDDLSIDFSASEQFPGPPQSQYSVHSYESELDVGRGMSVSELFSSSARLGTEQSESFRRHSSSGPLGSRKSKHFWERVRRLSGGSVSDHGSAFRFWSGSH